MSERQAALAAPTRQAVSRSPIGLDADAVVDAALALLDERGVPAFTIRALSAQLGVTAPTIYWHVGAKADLLQAVVDRVVTEIAATTRAAGTWDQRLRRFFAAAREQLLAHPGILELMRSVHSRALANWMTEAVDIMSDAGFDDDDAATYARIATTQAIASAQSELNAMHADYMEADPRDPSGRTYRVKPDMLPATLAPRVALSTTFNLDEQYDRTVDLFIAGVEAQLHRR